MRSADALPTPGNHPLVDDICQVIDAPAIIDLTRSPSLDRDLSNFTELAHMLRTIGATSKVRAAILVPLFYNPDTEGFRIPVEAEKIQQTEREIRETFGGYFSFPVTGWYRDPMTGEDFWDELRCYHMDFVPDAKTLAFLKGWKEVLRTRYRQRDSYASFEGVLVSL